MGPTILLTAAVLGFQAIGPACPSCGLAHGEGADRDRPRSVYRDTHRFWGRKLEAMPTVDPFAYQRRPGKVAAALETIFPPGPGHGWGFPNDAPDGFGWFDPGDKLPLGLTGDRTPNYYFRRQFAVPVNQIFFPTYYNAYEARGQRYIPYTNCGGAHPAGEGVVGMRTPVHPYSEVTSHPPVVPTPVFTGEVSATPLPTRPADVEDMMRRP